MVLNQHILENATFSDSIVNFGHIWLVQGVVLLCIVALIVFNWKRVFKFATSHMIALGITVWLSGVMLYAVGFSYEGTARSFPALLFRSMQAALGMFLSDNELIEVSELYKENPLYMTLFSVTHVSALFLSAILIFSTIGSRLKSSISVLFESIRAKHNDRPTYVFWGVNVPSVSLAQDIREDNPDARIIFLITYGENSLGEKLEITQLFDSNSAKHGHHDAMNGLEGTKGTLLVYLPKVEGSSKNRNLTRILESTTDLNFFFFAEDHNLNLSLAEMIVKGHQFKISESQKISIHVTSSDIAKRYAVEEGSVLHGDEFKNISLNFVDKSSLSVLYLKHDMNCYPVATYPDSAIVDGTVKGDFNAWILGLGHSGSEMFRFMYEFGSFIGPDNTPNKKRITVFDKDPDKSMGSLLRGCPDVLQEAVETPGMHVGSTSFWNLLSERADTLNCISVAMGDDEFDLKITREIYRHLLQFRKDTSIKVKIYLVIYTMEYEGIVRALASEYNAKGNNIEIIPFGGLSDVFSARLLLRRDIDEVYKNLNYKFDVSRGRAENMTPQECWNRDFSIRKYLDKYDGDKVIALDELYRRMEHCKAEVFQIATLVRLLGAKSGDDLNPDTISDKKYNSLVATAYLRQRSTHQLLGYTRCSEQYSRQNPTEAARQKLTPYVLPWEESTDKIRNVMSAIVDVSLDYASEFVNENTPADK